MIVNIRLDVDDVERNRLARLIDQKDVKRLATRDDYNRFIREIISKVGQGKASTEKRDPEPLETQESALHDLDSAPFDDHLAAHDDNPMETAPPAPAELDYRLHEQVESDVPAIARALYFVNEAMFIVSKRQRCPDIPDGEAADLSMALGSVLDLRHELVCLNDKWRDRA